MRTRLRQQKGVALEARGTVAGYVLEERLGDGGGGMGVMFRAHEERLQRPVALRIIPADQSQDQVLRARLNRESTALAAVDHPNVAPIYEAGEHDGLIIIATRWIDGVPLDQLVERDGPLEPRRAVKIVNQVAAALQAVHDLDLMHRNVKPQSVLVTDRDYAYLADFGLARRVTDEDGLTQQQDLLSTFDYVAPEYIEGGAVDRRVDIYGLGCVLYVALTGEVPFPAPSTAAKMYAHLSADPPSARQHNGEVPAALDAVIHRAMAKKPGDRQQSPGEFAMEAAGAVAMSAPPWVTVDRGPIVSALDSAMSTNGHAPELEASSTPPPEIAPASPASPAPPKPAEAALAPSPFEDVAAAPPSPAPVEEAPAAPPAGRWSRQDGDEHDLGDPPKDEDNSGQRLFAEDGFSERHNYGHAGGGAARLLAVSLLLILVVVIVALVVASHG